jgi:hypothetical protein
MPTVLRIEGFRFSSFAGDGVEPPHVHVSKGDAAAKICLQPIRIAYAHGFTPAELRRIREPVFQHAGFFLESWNEYFGR